MERWEGILGTSLSDNPYAMAQIVNMNLQNVYAYHLIYTFPTPFLTLPYYRSFLVAVFCFMASSRISLLILLIVPAPL
jgi:hypothetical protein